MAREFLTGIKSENRLSKVRLIMPNDPVIGGQPSDNADEFTSNTPFLDLACSIQYAITQATNANTAAATADGKAVAAQNTANTAMDAVGTKANSNVNIAAGNGLSGGGTLAAGRTIALGTPTTITATSTNSVTTTSHAHEIDKASTTVAGVVQLNNTVTSTSTTQAATANAVKMAYDRATSAMTTVVQTTGTSTTSVMSQNALTDLLVFTKLLTLKNIRSKLLENAIFPNTTNSTKLYFLTRKGTSSSSTYLNMRKIGDSDWLCVGAVSAQDAATSAFAFVTPGFEMQVEITANSTTNQKWEFTELS